MVHRCRHGLIPEQCGVCRREAARAEVANAQLSEKRNKKSELKRTAE